MVERALVLFRKIPFTCSYLPGSGNLTVRFGIYAIVFLVISETLFGQAEFALLHRLSGFALAAAVLIALAAWRRWRTTRYADSYAQLQFEELPPAELFSLDLKTDPGSNAPQSYIAAVIATRASPRPSLWRPRSRSCSSAVSSTNNSASGATIAARRKSADGSILADANSTFIVPARDLPP